MTASTVMSLVTAALYGDNGKLDPVDLQNASLSGGVVVGAVANLMIQPYGAIICGTVIGVISTLGFEVVQVSCLKHQFIEKCRDALKGGPHAPGCVKYGEKVVVCSPSAGRKHHVLPHFHAISCPNYC